ncbi:MAG: Vitamin transporter, B12-binding component BtuF [Bryobacterales bacterium]|nr:Vitamin transporter, B12-binding component BtuF [Bryobacterales bacterium]
MRRIHVLWLAAVALVCGHVYAQAPKRIVSTAPSITELLYALGLGDRVVGVDRFSRYPAEAQRKQKIGDYANPNLEVIAALRPDLVIIPTNPVRLAERLRTLRLKVLEIDQESIAKLYDSFRIIGQETGATAQAAKLTSTVREQLEAIRARAAPLKRTRMMFVVGRTPNRLDGLIVVGQASYLNEIIALAGGENVFRDAVAAYPAVSLEEVLARNPDVIVDMGDMADTAGVTEEHKREVASLWERLSSVAAVKQHRVQAVASDIYVVPGPRVVDAAKAFFEMLHPEAR